MASKSKNIIDALDLGILSEGDQEEVLLTLGDLIFRSSLVRLIERMDDGTREQFSELLSRDVSEDELLSFLKEKVPSSDEAVKEVVDELTDDILSVTK